MNKIILSALITLIALALNANAATRFYVDQNDQVFTKPAEGRSALDINGVSIGAKASQLKFSALTYLGYSYNDTKDGSTSNPAINYSNDSSKFEIRRAYLQLKAHFLDDPKSYYRVTLDASQDVTGDEKIRLKYAYLFLNEVLPFTGVEFGLVHRPWHDYEEHDSWYYRSISKVLIEDANGANLSNSADFGVNFKTSTHYFESEIGLFNGEGYHSAQATGTGMSFEWRATAHILGVKGKDKQTSTTYFDASFFGQYNQKHKADPNAPSGFDDLIFMGLHTVYNQPEFLLSVQYVASKDTADNSTYVSSQSGNGFSVNGEYRFGSSKEYRILARYDNWTSKAGADLNAFNITQEYTQKTYITGCAWEQNKNVQWIANATVTDNENGSSREKNNGTAYMLTAEVNF